MKLSSKYLILVAIVISSLASAQVSTGTPPYGSFGGGPFDIVNLGNLNVHLSIPVLHKAGRGVLFFYDLSYDSSIWYQATINGVVQWAPSSDWGWTSSSYAVLGRVVGTIANSTTVNGKICGGQPGSSTTTWTTYAYLDSRRKSHPFPGSTQATITTCPGGGGDSWGPGFGPTTATDGSGYSITVTVNESTGATTFDVVTRSGITVYNGNGTYTDTNGNQLTVNSGTGQFFDTLSSTTAVLTQAGSGTPTSPVTYTYTAPSGAAPQYTLNYTQYTVATHFSVSGVTEYGPLSNALVSSIQLPDGSEYQFTYEATTGSCTPLPETYSANCITGRINQITLPTKATITYDYTFTGCSTIIESDGSTACLSRTLSATATAQAQNWSYGRTMVNGPIGPGSTWTTTVIDPSSNYTVINSAEDSTVTSTGSNPTIATYNFYETQRKMYQGSVSSNNCSSSTPNNCLLLTTTNCYNAHYSNCSTSTVGTPIVQTDRYSQPAGGQTRLSETLYGGYGMRYDDKEYDYGVTMGGAPGNAHLIRETAITFGSYNGSGCTALTGINSKPCQVIVYDWTGTKTTLASSSYTYDQGTPTSTSNTPQHVAPTGSRGLLTTATASTSGTASLSKTFTYYDTGNPKVDTDVNAAQTTFEYSSVTNPYNSSFTASCGNSFATKIDEPLSLSRSLQWNCIGGVAPQVTDENSYNVTSNYTDADFWRPSSVIDQMGNQTNISYYTLPTAENFQLRWEGCNN